MCERTRFYERAGQGFASAVLWGILIQFMLPAQAQAQGFCIPNPFVPCEPASKQGQPSRSQPSQHFPDVRPSKPTPPLDPSKYYIVQVKCRPTTNTAVTVSDGLIVKDTTGVTESLWIAPQGTGENGSKVPINPAKIINFATGTIASTGNVDFVNQACDKRFIIPGTASRFTVLYGVQDAKALSKFGTLLYGALSLFSGLAPTFAGGPLFALASKTAVADTKAISGTQDPLTKLITGANGNPNLVAKSYALGTSKAISIQSPIGNISMTVTELTDIASEILKDPTFTRQFYAMINSLVPSLTGATPVVQCTNFANEYITSDYKFGDKDEAFILGYIAQQVSAGDKDNPGSKQDRLACINSNKLANYVLHFPYNRKVGDLDPLTQQDVDDYPWKKEAPVLIDKYEAWRYLNSLGNAIADYSYSNRSDAKRNALVAITGANEVDINDISARVWPQNAKLTVVDFINQLIDKNYTIFGCFTYGPFDVSYDGAILAIPSKPSPNTTQSGNGKPATYDMNELLAIEIGVKHVSGRQTTNVRSILLSDNETISSVANKKGWQCGYGGPNWMKIAQPPQPPKQGQS